MFRASDRPPIAQPVLCNELKAAPAFVRWHEPALSRSALAGLDLWRLFATMTKISYAGYRFPPDIIQQAIWLYVRFTLSFRDVEDLLAERRNRGFL